MRFKQHDQAGIFGPKVRKFRIFSHRSRIRPTKQSTTASTVADWLAWVLNLIFIAR